MAFKCENCSYKGARADQGLCPACGSPNIHTIGKGNKPEQSKRPTRIRYCLLILVWLVFGYELYKLLVLT